MVVGILNLFTFMSMWESMKLTKKQEDLKH